MYGKTGPHNRTAQGANSLLNVTSTQAINNRHNLRLQQEMGERTQNFVVVFGSGSWMIRVWFSLRSQYFLKIRF